MNYIGITIGPVVGTMEQTSTPAGLWAASYLFSELSKQICLRLPEGSIVTPYYEVATNGVGLFPDRIILKAGACTPGDLTPWINEAIDEVARLFAIKDDETNQEEIRNYLHDYLQVHAVTFETNDNPIEYSKGFLGAAELERGFAAIDEGTLLHQFERREENRSKSWPVKDSVLVQKLDKAWPLRLSEDDDRIRDLADIASDGRAKYNEEKRDYTFNFEGALKKHRYYAVIQADGDNIGKTICGLPPEKIGEFSEKCWKYSTRAAKIVQDFHGVPIYVGGDDLLAITPVENANGKNIFALMQELRDAFDKQFKAYQKGEHPPALSFGVSIQYYKFPLYESLTQARNLLFDHAKKASGKNAIALRLQKHSGQSVQLVFAQGADPAEYLEPCESFEDQLLHSIMTHLRLHERLFATALRKEVAQHAFRNVFAEELHKQKDLPEQMGKLLALCEKGRVLLDEDQLKRRKLKDENGKWRELKDEKNEWLAVMDGILRLQKFFVETGEEG